MSRIGKLPIAIPSGVEVKVGADVVEVKGAKAALTTPVCDLLSYEVADGHITLTRKAETRESRAQHGLRRTLLANCIEGVTKGFSKTLEVIGVGYRVAVKGNVIELQVGFSHPVLVELPAGLSAKVEGQKLTIMGADKVLVGEMAARIRRIRKPEPYKGKGIKYETETILRKAGKSGGKGKYSGRAMSTMTKNEARQRRKIRIRKKISGTAERPRLVIFRSNLHMYAQVVDDLTGAPLAATSTLVLSKGGEKVSCNKAGAEAVGKEIARLAKEKRIEKVVFDRNGYLYHGKIKAVADGAREGGLEF